MRREGRQHGLVLTVEPAAGPSPPGRRGRLLVGAVDSPPTTGFRTRVPGRPTNHSKYTGRSSAGPRQQPFSKSRDKSKGSHKLRDLDVGLNPRLASWRVAGGAAGWGGLAVCGGGSASAAAVYLSGYPLVGGAGARWDCLYDEQRWPDEDFEGSEEESMEEEVGGRRMMMGSGEEAEEEVEGGEEGGEMEQERVIDGDGGDEVMEEDMGFCEVWYVWDYVDEEDWCVVGEMEM